MVADGVHILVAVALVLLVVRTDRAEPYLVAILAAGFPDLDRYLFAPLIYSGHLTGVIWTHRGITHSLAALLLCVGAGYLVGRWRAAALGYGSHLVADFLTGGIRLFAPLSPELYGLYYDWMLGNVVAGAASVVVVVGGVAALRRREAGTPAAGTETDLLGRLSGWWFR